MNERFILENQLKSYAAEGLYPMHMPGHKREMTPAPDLPFAWDVTELPGTDDLHEATGILAEAMARTASLYGVIHTWYLVNGSTCGNLAAIRAAVPYGGELLVARNSHKSVYHAIELGNLQAHYLMPQMDEAFDICGSVRPQQVAQMLRKYPDSKAVVLTSPTYEGVLSDVAQIAQMCHQAGIPLIVDEAHGAHLGILPEKAQHFFPKGAVQSGADLVIQSPHKTLPSLTQTAWMHLQGTLIQADEVERQLDVFETSSPSYPLLASLDGCTGILRESGEELMHMWEKRICGFSEQVRGLKYLSVMCHGSDNLQNHPGFFSFDPGKILISGWKAGYTGRQLAEVFRERFGFETEMSCGDNLLAMTSLCDTEEAMQKFAQALCILDQECEENRQKRKPTGYHLTQGETVMTIARAEKLPFAEVPIAEQGKGTDTGADTARQKELIGRISAEYIWAYPPGIPLLVPGERIEEEVLQQIRELTLSRTALIHSRLGAGHLAVACLV